MQTHSKYNNSGFTILEVAIVLVLVGLIVVGVLVGRDMISTAEIRNAVGQIENYSSATNAFKNKYDQYPGDLSNANVYIPGTISGNGDSRIEDAGGNSPPDTYDGELPQYWVQLGEAEMINTSMTDPAGGAANLGTHIPEAAVNGGLIAYSNGARAFFWFGIDSNMADADAAGAINTASGPTMSPIQAFGIDNKLDDGRPNTGNIMQLQQVDSATDGTGGFAACADAGVTSDYKGSDNTDQCALRVRMSI